MRSIQESDRSLESVRRAVVLEPGRNKHSTDPDSSYRA
jgi:hypothetical protein